MKSRTSFRAPSSAHWDRRVPLTVPQFTALKAERGLKYYDHKLWSRELLYVPIAAGQNRIQSLPCRLQEVVEVAFRGLALLGQTVQQFCQHITPHASDLDFIQHGHSFVRQFF